MPVCQYQKTHASTRNYKSFETSDKAQETFELCSKCEQECRSPIRSQLSRQAAMPDKSIVWRLGRTYWPMEPSIWTFLRTELDLSVM